MQQLAAQLYHRFVENIKKRIRTAQIKVALAANAELVLNYCEIGRDILAIQKQEGWGAKVSGGDSRVEGNRARNNVGTGILAGASDLIIRNWATGNTTNYNPASGANFGPLDPPNTTTHPTANF